jgi:CRP/FNR family transcriptional regulator
MDDLQRFKVWMEQIPFLTKQDFDLVEPFLFVKKISEKQMFLSEGDVCREMGFVNSGAFRMYYLSQGKEINACFFFENDFATDYVSFVNQKTSRYFIQALEDSEVIIINPSLLKHAYDTSINWERIGRIMLEANFKDLTARTETLLFVEGKDRYLQLIKTHPFIFDRVPLYHIASYLGMERESLSRIRKKITQKK